MYTSNSDKPEILGVKLGYNPNSSSIGIMVEIFLYHTIVISGIFVALGYLLRFKKNKEPVGALANGATIETEATSLDKPQKEKGSKKTKSKTNKKSKKKR